MDIILGCLFFAWIFSLFGFDHLVIVGMQEVFGITISKLGYYFLWVVLAVIIIITRALRGKDIDD